MNAYHFRWYTFLLILVLYFDAEARLRDGWRTISFSVFFGVEVSCWLQKDIIIDSISFSKLQQQEGSSTGRIITRIYSCVWYIRTLQTAVIGSLSPLNVPNKGQIRTILCTVACEGVSCCFLRSYHTLSHSHMQLSLPFSSEKKVRSVWVTLREV